MNKYSYNQPLKKRLVGNLNQFEADAIETTPFQRAAMAIVVIEHAQLTSQASILVTRRPATLRQHSGQYALPGGKIDGNETTTQAALRELEAPPI